MTRKKLIAANWKMNKKIFEAETFAVSLRASLTDIPDCDLVLFPPFLSLPTVARELGGTGVGIGAQDIFWEEEGAFTGEVSGEMIRDAGAGYVLVGHSERRNVIGEDDETVARKLRAALSSGLTPILCVGEKLSHREAGEAETFVERQLDRALSVVSPGEAEELVVAYEPVWAIGTGKTATPDDAEEMHALVRRLFGERFGNEAGGRLRVQYGGSVKPENAGSLLERREIDGLLVGGASLEVDTFIAIARAVP